MNANARGDKLYWRAQFLFYTRQNAWVSPTIESRSTAQLNLALCCDTAIPKTPHTHSALLLSTLPLPEGCARCNG
jgi:hypothetical protein